MSKKYQQSIRILGKLIRSPNFDKKSDLDNWITHQRMVKQSIQSGVTPQESQRITLREYFSKTWLPKRKEKKSRATWASDEQRFRDYVDNSIGGQRISKLNLNMIKTCLETVVAYHGMSIQTRNRVRALLSKILNDARNEKIPLRSDNPALGVQFDDERDGDSTEPEYLSHKDDVKGYLKAAKELGPNYYLVACFGIMAGLRKSEMIALTWGDIDSRGFQILVTKRFVQAEGKVSEGTKGGKKKTRKVPASDLLLNALLEQKNKTDFCSDDDFILTKPDGGLMGPRDISRLTEETCKHSGLDITTHGLRHTFGRLFAIHAGNMKALQGILGHSNQSTTELYSKLSGESVNKFRNAVSIDLEDDDA